MTIAQIKEKIVPVLQNHPISKAGIFGSYARGEETRESDVDILVELTATISLLEYAGIKIELEDALGKAVDLLQYKMIRPILKEEILSEEVRIYG